MGQNSQPISFKFIPLEDSFPLMVKSVRQVEIKQWIIKDKVHNVIPENYAVLLMICVEMYAVKKDWI